MTRLSYVKALDAALKPLGFVRSGNDWVRLRGNIWDCVNRQKSWIDGGVTANLFAKDLETDRILRSVACKYELWVRPTDTRIGALIDGNDRWWKNDPNGPAELAEAVLKFGIPWFDRVQTLEDQADLWYGRASTVHSWSTGKMFELAVTLYRMGAVDEALALFETPVRRTEVAQMLARGRCLQRWMLDQPGVG